MDLKHRKGLWITLIIVVCLLLGTGGWYVYRVYQACVEDQGSYTVTNTYEVTASGDIHLSGPVDCHQLASSVARTIEKSDIVELDWNQLESSFGLADNQYVAVSVYLAKKDTSAFEIAVFQFASEEQKQLILQAIQRRKAQKLASFKELNQAEYSLVEQAIIAEQDNFLLFAVCKTPQKALDIFHEVIKGS